jgi:hypothetical protein
MRSGCPVFQAPRRGDRGDRGQVSTELMGIIVVIAAVIAAIAAVGLGSQISADIGAAICKISGGSNCSPGTALQTPTTECETLSSSAEVGGDVVVFSVDVGGTGKHTLSRTVDRNGKEHWYVTLQGDARVGANVMLGQKARLGDFGEGVSAEIKALAKGSVGAKYEFPSENAAREFITDAEHELVKQGLLPSTSDPFGLGHKLMDKIDGRSFKPPPAKEYFIEGGGQLDGSAELTAGVGSVGASTSGSAVLGIKVSPQPTGKPHNTVYIKVSQEAALKLGLFETVAGEASSKGEVVVGIEYDGDGKAVTATLDVAGTLKAQLGPKFPLGPKSKLGDFAGLKPEGTPKLSENLGTAVAAKAQFRVDLTQGNNRQVLADGLHSIGVPVLMNDGSADPPNPYQGVKGIYDLFDDGAPGTQLTVNTYDQQTGGETLAVKGGDVLTFGVEGGLKFEDRTITGGAYYSPGNGFVNWEPCSK